MDLPSGWIKTRFSDSIKKVSISNDLKIKQKEYLSSGRYPIVDQGQDLVGGYTDNEGLLLQCETPVIVFGDHTKTVKYLRFSFCAGADGIKVFTVQPFLNSRLLYFFILFLAKKIPDKGYARHYQYLEKEFVPLPPLAEQHRIVEKIDTLFSELDKGVEYLQMIKKQLKIYRQAVLKSAFEGKLTCTDASKWDYKTPDELSAPNKHALVIGPFGSDLKVSDYTDYGVPLIFVRDIRSMFHSTLQKYISPDKAQKLIAHRVVPGDVLITKMGDPPGDCCIYPSSRQEAIITADCIKWSVDPARSTPEYIAHAVMSPYVQGQIKSITKGVAQKKVSLEQFRRILIPLPEFHTQRELVSAIDARLSACDQFEQLLDAAFARSDSLRQSILKKAFEGRLVPQDPNDEPAEKLLERIRAERSTQTSSRGRRQKNV